MLRLGSAARGRALRSISVLLGAAALVASSTAAPGRVAADGPNRAAVVVTLSEGQSESRCVEFSEPEISGAELLRRSGLPVVASSQSGGAAICEISDVGCANPSDCFCECHGGGCQYWAYYTQEEGQWQYASAGSSLRKVHDGDVDGWAWGSGSIGNGAKPKLLAFADVCPPLSPTTVPAPVSPPVAAAATPSPWILSPVLQPEASSTPSPTSVVTPTPGLGVHPPEGPLAGTQTDPAAQEGGDDRGRSMPRQFLAFGGLTAVLLTMALVLARRRAHG